MSFAVCRMDKMKAPALKGIQFHNQRERESRTNFDIDESKTKLNYDLANQEKIDYNKRVKEIIESQKTGERKIRKDAVLVNSWMITSDLSFFDNLKPEEERRFFEEAYKFFSDRYGKQNIAYAVVHKDEKTPHMHVGVVPMRDGKLQSKNIFNRIELFAIQDDFPKHMMVKGFDLERGEKGSDREHVTTQKFKAAALKENIQSLEKALLEKEKETQEIKNRLTEMRAAAEEVKQIEQISFKESSLFGPKTVKLAAEDFESIKTLAKASEGLKIENKRLNEQGDAVVQSYSKHMDEFSELQDDFAYEKRVNQHLRKENQKLQKENKGLKNQLEYIRKFLRENQLVDHFQDWAQEMKKKVKKLRKTEELER